MCHDLSIKAPIRQHQQPDTLSIAPTSQPKKRLVRTAAFIVAVYYNNNIINNIIYSSLNIHLRDIKVIIHNMNY